MKRSELDRAAVEIIRRFQEGDQEAFAELFRLYSQEVYKILYSVLGHRNDLEDLLQETFLQVLRTLNRFKFNSSFSTWLYRVTLNVAYMYLRKQSHKPDFVPIEDVQGSVSEEGILESVDNEIVRQKAFEVLETIDEKKRIVFILFEFGGYELKEIAEMLDISLANVKSRLHYARKEFYKKWSKVWKNETATLAEPEPEPE